VTTIRADSVNFSGLVSADLTIEQTLPIRLSDCSPEVGSRMRFVKVSRAHFSRMLRQPFLSSPLAAGVAVASVAVSGVAFADPAAFSPWIGAYESAAPAQAESTIERAIEEGTSSMGALRRSVARSRLKTTNQPYRRVRIAPAGDELVTDFDGRTYKAPTDGRAEQGKDPDGKAVTVSYATSGDTLKTRYVGEDGEKWIDFERTPDGQGLIMRVTVLSKKLPGPIKYSVRYVKQ